MPMKDMPARAPGARRQADMIMHAALIRRRHLLMGSDDPTTDSFGPVQGMQVNYSTTDVAEAKRVFDALADGGRSPCRPARRSSRPSSACASTGSGPPGWSAPKASSRAKGASTGNLDWRTARRSGRRVEGALVGDRPGPGRRRGPVAICGRSQETMQRPPTASVRADPAGGRPITRKGPAVRGPTPGPWRSGHSVTDAGGPPPGTFAATSRLISGCARPTCCRWWPCARRRCPACRRKARACGGHHVDLRPAADRQPDPVQHRPAGVTGFLKTLAREVAASRVTVNSLQPARTPRSLLAEVYGDTLNDQVPTSRPACWAARRTSASWSPSSAPTTPPLSPARPSRSMVAPTPGCSDGLAPVCAGC